MNTPILYSSARKASTLDPLLTELLDSVEEPTVDVLEKEIRQLRQLRRNIQAEITD
jgi:hypothetical protein